MSRGFLVYNAGLLWWAGSLAFLVAVMVGWCGERGTVTIVNTEQLILESPLVYFEDFSVCSIQIDAARISEFLTNKGFSKELHLFVLAGPIPGRNVAAGTFAPTNYGAKIVLDGSYLGEEVFSENEDHEFGHMVQWLELGDEAYYNLSKKESESFANTFAENNDLNFISTDVPALTANEEGVLFGPFLFRLEGERPVLYVFDKDNPNDFYLLLSGKPKIAQLWSPEGWHVIPEDQFEYGLVAYGGYCVRLE